MNNGEPEEVQTDSRHRRPLAGHRRVWWIAGIAVVATVVVAAAVVIEERSGESTTAGPATTSAPSSGSTTMPEVAPTSDSAAEPNAATLKNDFAQFEATLDGHAGIALGAVGGRDDAISLGDWQSGVAWSTIKIPLALAALRQDDSHIVTDSMKAAITESDNAAAEAIWATLGDPVDAAAKVQDVLRQAGDNETSVPSTKKRQEFTIFGQTEWSLTHQVQFISAAACDPANGPILSLMGQIEPGQSWGIGKIPNTQFKGGWGPSTQGKYLVRQFGVITTPSGGKIAVALATEPNSGQFADGTDELTRMADWLNEHLALLPEGRCGS